MSQLENKWIITESQVYDLRNLISHLHCNPIRENTVAKSVENLENFVEQTKENAKSIEEILNDLEVVPQ